MKIRLRSGITANHRQKDKSKYFIQFILQSFYELFFPSLPLFPCWQLRTNWKRFLAFPSCISLSDLGIHLQWADCFRVLDAFHYCWHRSWMFFPPHLHHRLISFMFIQLKLAGLRKIEVVCHLSFYLAMSLNNAFYFFFLLNICKSNFFIEFLLKQPG